MLALPLFAVAGFPMLGYLTGALAWVVQRAIQVALQRRATAARDPRTAVGLTAASMIGRGWLVALGIFAVGLADNEVGLAGAVLFIALFTVYFAAQLILRPLERGGPGS